MGDYEVELPDEPTPEPEPPASTPEPGETYQRAPSEPVFRVADVGWQHPQHKLWAAQREARGLEPPFYVTTPSGELAWVPWPGSKVVSQEDIAWEMDMFRPNVDSDLKKGK